MSSKHLIRLWHVQAIVIAWPELCGMAPRSSALLPRLSFHVQQEQQPLPQQLPQFSFIYMLTKINNHSADMGNGAIKTRASHAVSQTRTHTHTDIAIARATGHRHSYSYRDTVTYAHTHAHSETHTHRLHEASLDQPSSIPLCPLALSCSLTLSCIISINSLLLLSLMLYKIIH